METIPDEVFEIICGKLSARDLQSVMLIDRYSRFIIENSPVLMNELPLLITDNDIDEFDDNVNRRLIEPLLSSRRKVVRVVVTLKTRKIMEYFLIFKKFGETIRSLEIKNYSFETIDQLRLILRHLNNLTSLKVSNVSFQKPENEVLNSIVQIPKLKLRHLRELDCENTDPKIFSLFTNNHDVQLRTIRLHSSDAQRFYSYVDVVEMMNHQKFLRHLTIDGMTSLNSDFFDNKALVKCQLDFLSVSNCSITFREQMRNWAAMIKDQRKLKVLKVLNTPILSSMDIMFTYRQIFSNCVTEVHVDIGNLSIFHSHSFVNFTVRDMTLYGEFAFENLPIFINFIRIFPNVVRLKIVGDSGIGDKYLFHILSTLQSLEELYLPGFTSRKTDSNFSNLSSLRVNKLKTLVLNYIDYDLKFFGWKNIVTNLSSIEKLVIKRDYGKVSNEIVDVIMKTLKLRHLELGIGFVSEKILHNIFYTNFCEQLKTLKMAKSDLMKIQNFSFEKTTQGNNLLLYFCDDDYFC